MFLHFDNSLYFQAAYPFLHRKPLAAHWAMFHLLLTRLAENVAIDTLVNRRQDLVQANRALVDQVGDALCCHSDGFVPSNENVAFAALTFKVKMNNGFLVAVATLFSCGC